jgi:hypothetical protein
MALDRNALQKKRAKREAKRKVARKAASGSPGSLSATREWTLAASAPIVDVFVPAMIFEAGIGTVWMSRHLPDGRYAIVGILVDIWCLGVKNAMYKIMDSSEYTGLLKDIHSNPYEQPQPQSPAYARKLIEDALAYAADLGFEPHPDYRIARLILGDIDTAECPESFVFGKGGKPFYVNGPNDTPSMQRRTLKQLERRCGPDGYHYRMGFPGDPML